ncbi:hypothetical protein [Kutzneria buriramensis]|uniref:Uncharacterized protein n=1 Tax=Kutzneria buriramensis TaxID=1045776 RepID=A0A3E0GUJ8_9PSEU|nr:hypothetical protein [Kutzneria buriramensis]REH28570.1 hypothetical protein BCF44_12612 [Kutzneria buriramensis]
MGKNSAVSFFANGPAGAAVRPLDLTDSVAPASCFWAAANGAALGVITVAICEKAVEYVTAHFVHGNFSTDHAPEIDGMVVSLSGDELIALLDNVSSNLR